jgi:LCP family protein required for cell wall assembly
MTDIKRERPRRVRRTPSALRHGQVKAKGLGATLSRYLGSAVAVVLVAALSVSAIALWDITRGLNAGVALAGDQPAVGPIEGEVNILLVGSDGRAGQAAAAGEDASGNLNDVNMLIHINKDHTNATVISIPRDMVVSFPKCPGGGGGWTGPINSVLSEGGLPCIALTVEKLTGVDIPYAAMVGFDGVVSLSNIVGGVDVCVATAMQDSYTGVTLSAGMHTLSGQDALLFLRSRHGVGDGSDLGRISSQQAFLSSLIRKLKSSDTLANPAKLFSIAKAVTTNMTLSSSMSGVDTLVSIAMALRNIPLETITFLQYPGTTGGEGVYTGKVQPDFAAAKIIFDALAADQPISLTGGTGRGSVQVTPSPSASPAAAGTRSAIVGETVSLKSVTTPTPTITPTPAPSTVTLPSDVNGQTADQVTCTKGRSLSEQ